MGEKFVVRPKNRLRGDDKAVVMTLRMERELQEKYDALSGKSGHSRNELMCMALRFALDNLEFIPDEE